MKTYYHANNNKVCNLIRIGKVRGKGISCWKKIEHAIGWAKMHKGYKIICIDTRQTIKKDWSWGYIKTSNISKVY